MFTIKEVEDRKALNTPQSTHKQTFKSLHHGSHQHNIAVTGKGVGFYTDRAGGCHSQYLGVVELKQDKYDSHAQFGVLYGNRGKWQPKVTCISHIIDIWIWAQNSREDFEQHSKTCCFCLGLTSEWFGVSLKLSA